MAIDSTTSVWPENLPVPLRAHKKVRELLVSRTEMDSGRIRKRRIVEDPRDTLEATWNFTSDQFEGFKTFFDVNLENGQNNFLITLFGAEREVVFRDSTYSFTHSDNLYTVNASLFIEPLLDIPFDDFELYDDGANLGGRDGGENWAPNPWVSRATNLGIQCFDDFEYYTDGADAHGLNGGVHFPSAYVSRANFTGIQVYDTMEEYTDGVQVDDLSGGTRWFAYPYHDRLNFGGLQAVDDFESYADGADVNGLNGGIGWLGFPYVE